jgi:hypothetical protein
MSLRLNGAAAVLRCSGALWLPSSGMLVVADLHFEKGSAYGVRGQLLPPYDTRATLERLEREIAAVRPHTLVFLGDSFHDGEGENRLDADDFARLAALADERALVWIVGNHDADGPRRLPGRVAETLEIDSLTLVHEPQPGLQPGEVAGHLHPSAKVIAYGRAARSRCFLTDGERLILPAFGAYAGGLNACDPAFAGLFARPPVAAALGRDRVHAISWSRLCAD